MEKLFRERIKSKLDSLDQLGLRRSLPDIEHGNERLIRQDDNSYVNFSSNDYLALSTSQEVIQTAQSVLERYGIGSGGSRLICGNHPLYGRLEDQIADWKGRESALVFGSGFLTSTGVIRAVMNSRDLILYDELSHRCLLEGIQLSQAHAMEYAHNDIEEMRSLLDEHASEYDAVLVVTEGIFSMDGDRSPLNTIREVTSGNGAWLMVDEAHSAGVWGTDGAGLTVELDSDVEISMGTLSKAVGGYGGYVAGDESFVKFLVNRATTLIYSTGLPAGVLAGNLTALKKIRDQTDRREKVKDTIDQVKEWLDQLSVPYPEPPSQIIPLLTGETEHTMEASEVLRSEGIYAVPIRYPTVPRKKGRVRISLRSDHTSDDLKKLWKGLEKLDQADLLSRENIWRS